LPPNESSIPTYGSVLGKKAAGIAEGKAPAAGNQQANSPPFAVNVVK